MRIKTLWIKEAYLEQILAGTMKVEVRVAYANIARMQPGDSLMLNDHYPFRIRDIRRYSSFDALLQNEIPAEIAADLSREELLSALHELYPPEKEALGVIALQIEPG